MSTESQESLVNHQPKQEDPADIRITSLIREQALKTSWAKERISQVQKNLISYYKTALQLLHSNPKKIHDLTQGLVSNIAKTTNAKIHSGKEHLNSLPKGKPCFLVGNHYGFYKLTNIHPLENCGIDVGLKEMHALPTFFAAYKPVAQALEDNLYSSAFKFPGDFGELQEPAGWITIPLQGAGGVDTLTNATREKIREYPNYALTVLPEGGTSGKRNGGSPYSLGPFRTGSFVVAGMLQLPIIPVAQFFNPIEGEGFEIGVFPPITPKNPNTMQDSKTYFGKLAQDTQAQIQVWLNERVAAVYP